MRLPRPLRCSSPASEPSIRTRQHALGIVVGSLNPFEPHQDPHHRFMLEPRQSRNTFNWCHASAPTRHLMIPQRPQPQIAVPKSKPQNLIKMRRIWDTRSDFPNPSLGRCIRPPRSRRFVRSVGTPTAIGLSVNSRRLDNPPADGGRFYLQRCLPKNDTAASYEFLPLRAVDATDCSSADGELQAV